MTIQDKRWVKIVRANVAKSWVRKNQEMRVKIRVLVMDTMNQKHTTHNESPIKIENHTNNWDWKHLGFLNDSWMQLRGGVRSWICECKRKIDFKNENMSESWILKIRVEIKKIATVE